MPLPDHGPWLPDLAYIEAQRLLFPLNLREPETDGGYPFNAEQVRFFISVPGAPLSDGTAYSSVWTLSGGLPGTGESGYVFSDFASRDAVALYEGGPLEQPAGAHFADYFDPAGVLQPADQPIVKYRYGMVIPDPGDPDNRMEPRLTIVTDMAAPIQGPTRELVEQFYGQQIHYNDQPDGWSPVDWPSGAADPALFAGALAPGERPIDFAALSEVGVPAMAVELPGIGYRQYTAAELPDRQTKWAATNTGNADSPGFAGVWRFTRTFVLPRSAIGQTAYIYDVPFAPADNPMSPYLRWGSSWVAAATWAAYEPPPPPDGSLAPSSLQASPAPGAIVRGRRRV